MEDEDIESLLTEDTSNWFQAIQEYVKKTEATSLNLRTSSEEMDMFVLPKTEGTLQFLEDSQITELHLLDHNLRGQMNHWSKLLVKTKVRKLNVKFCDLTCDDFLILMKELKDTQITDLDVSHNEIRLNDEKVDEFVAYLTNSHLTSLNFTNILIGPPYRASILFQNLPSTSITHLNLTHALNSDFICSEWRDADDLPFELDPLTEPVFCLSTLFSNLRHSAIKDLNLSFNLINNAQMMELGDNLKNSKLEKLDVSSNNFDDVGVDFLVAGLIDSKITHLNLRKNKISGANSLGQSLKNTQIMTLDLSENKISNLRVFSPPHFLEESNVVTLKIRECGLNGDIGSVLMRELKFSKVTELDLSYNELDSLRGPALVDLIKHSRITQMDLSQNCFTPDLYAAIGDCLKESTLKHIDVSRNYHHAGQRGMSQAFAYFLEKTKGSLIDSVSTSANCLGLGVNGVAVIAQGLTNTAIKILDFHENKLGINFMKLALQLKFTAITHLNLSKNCIEDKGANALANCLKKTEIRDLNVAYNSITSLGAKALALSLKNTKLLRLNLECNNIENDGIEALAESAENTSLTVLSVSGNRGNRRLLVDSVLWKNRTRIRLSVDSLCRIVVENKLDLDRGFDNRNINAYIDDCLSLYRDILKCPWSVLIAIGEDKSLSLSEQVVSLMLEEFPREFAAFVGRRLETDAAQHVSLLKRMEGEGFGAVVKFLLLNRPAYMIDESQGILHPFVYLMLHKYKQPLYNLDIEPQGKQKIIEYFVKHIDLDSASEVISLLNENEVS